MVAAVDRARPGRVVVSTSGQIVDDTTSPLSAAADSPISVLVRGVEATGISTAIVEPRLFLENLLLPVVETPIHERGILRYPLPPELPVSWSSHLDVADVVSRLLTDRSITGTVGVGSTPGLLGTDLAAGFSEFLGRSVTYAPITPEQFGGLILPLFGRGSAAVVALYQQLGMLHSHVIPSDTSAQRLLGLTPRTPHQWLKDLSALGAN